jgi:hypothetical protein
MFLKDLVTNALFRLHASRNRTVFGLLVVHDRKVFGKVRLIPAKHFLARRPERLALCEGHRSTRDQEQSDRKKFPHGSAPAFSALLMPPEAIAPRATIMVAPATAGQIFFIDCPETRLLLAGYQGRMCPSTPKQAD